MAAKEKFKHDFVLLMHRAKAKLLPLDQGMVRSFVTSHPFAPFLLMFD
jgi:hypothetical protein